ICLLGFLACIFLNELVAGYKRVAGTVQRKREQWRKLYREERERKIQLQDLENVADAADPGTSRQTVEENAAAPSRVMHQDADEMADSGVPMPDATASGLMPTTAGFDIDDDVEGDNDYTVRTRTLDHVVPREVESQEAPSVEDEDRGYQQADIQEPIEEDTVSHESEETEAGNIESLDKFEIEDTEDGDTDFVVRTAPTEEFIPIDELEDDAVAADESDAAEHVAHSAAHVANLPPFDPRAELSRYRFPDVDLLITRDDAPVVNMEEQRANKDLIVKTLLDYKIPIDRIEATVGPTVTLYEVRPAEGVRIAQIKRLEDDIALSLSALGIRIIAPIPGKDVVGIEVPNRKPQIVSIRRVLDSQKFRDCNMRLPMAIGATISNDIFIADLTKMPHMLVAGATGQGKSVGLNCILASLLYKRHPSELKLVLIDPKMVEFSLYSKLERHYLAKLPDEEDAIVTDPMKAAATLHSLCIEMDNRYQLLKQAGVRNIEEYNDKFIRRRLNPEKGHGYMPYIVMVVDEFADLIMQAGKEVSVSIARIAQKARAVGMHMIIATQRPSTDVISGMIKNNFPGRIAFKVSQMVDSRTILDSPGANRLIGRGDMLFSLNSVMTRVQCALIETSEVEAICDHINDQIGFSSPFLLPEIPQEGGGAVDSGLVDLSKRDPMFDQCARFIVTQSTASTSMLQRRFGIGYNKAGKIMDQMEAAGIVGPACGQKPRAILVDSITCEEIINNA
ncbi:MAG: DNA translocase FtsK, partial [Muribaculaceae bacterium]|nr:DNA translocase FtsK [Muribaculaceae bacterium]